MTPIIMSCRQVRDRLHAFLDGELRPAEQAAVNEHLDGCTPCSTEIDDYRAVGSALRARVDAAAVPTEALAEMADTVVSLTTAEARQSLRSRMSVAFEDMRFVFAGAGSLAATFACAIGLAGILQVSAVARSDSLASLMERMAAPPGSTMNPYRVNPRLLPPHVHQDSLVMPAVLVDDVPYALPDEEYAFSGVLTSEGRVAGIEMLEDGAAIGSRAMELLRSMHDSRFSPARLKNGRAVAVTFVWVHSDVTIKPTKSL